MESAEEMHDAVMAHREADIVIMAAAVADYAPMERATKKIKKGSGNMVLHLRRTPDILYALQQRRAEGQLLVGFAMETSEGLENARKKLHEKTWIGLCSTCSLLNQDLKRKPIGSRCSIGMGIRRRFP